MARSASSEHGDGAKPTPRIVTAGSAALQREKRLTPARRHGAERIERARRRSKADAEDSDCTRAALQREKRLTPATRHGAKRIERARRRSKADARDSDCRKCSTETREA
eukprot:scaffold92009_cov68-Phaeocystis_antarctica.AAC.3